MQNIPIMQGSFQVYNAEFEGPQILNVVVKLRQASRRKGIEDVTTTIRCCYRYKNNNNINSD
jgi:hypothetical protein